MRLKIILHVAYRRSTQAQINHISVLEEINFLDISPLAVI